MNVTGICPYALLAELHNHTRPLGMGWMEARGDLTPEEAREWVEGGEVIANPDSKGLWRADYVFGRPIKVWLERTDKGEVVLNRPDLYDRDAPEGVTVAAIVESLRA